jgi:type I restriction enzyme S subunit
VIHSSAPSVKNSDIAWVGHIPTHWQIKRAKFLFALAQRPPRDNDGIVTAFRDGQVTLRSNRRTDGFTNALKEAGYQGVRQGDLVIHAMDAFAGAVGISESDGKCSPVYSCCTPRTDAVSGFYAQCVRTMATTGYIESLAKGIRERSTDFRWATFAEQLLPVPPVREQVEIVNFLDRETARIDALIEKKARFIELLREKRQALITHAVTKGLDPAAPMKDSGVEWLGQVPADWSTAPLKTFLALRRDIVGEASATTKLLSLTIHGVIERDRDNHVGKMPASFDSYQRIAKGEMVFCLFDMDETPRTVGVAEQDGMLTGAYTVFKPQSTLWARFLYYFFIHVDEYKRLKSFYKGLRKTIRPGPFLSIQIPKPHDDVVGEIVERLDMATTRIDTLIAKTERSIELLREKRSALITAAVTGKIDLRDAA